jgi:hypothetical protein
MRNATKILTVKPKRITTWKTAVDEWITLELIFEKQGGKVWNGCIWLRTGTSGGPL